MLNVESIFQNECLSLYIQYTIKEYAIQTEITLYVHFITYSYSANVVSLVILVLLE